MSAPQIPPLSTYVTLVLGDTATFTPDVYGEIGVLTFNGEGCVGVSTTSVEVLLALADAAQATAAKLRAAQVRGEARRAVA